MKLSDKTGSPQPLGLSHKGLAHNFSLYAPKASTVTLSLFRASPKRPDCEFPLYGPSNGVWHIEIAGIPPGACYAYRIDSSTNYYTDPYAPSYASEQRWGEAYLPRLPWLGRCDLAEPFDWQDVHPPRHPLERLVIYELHVRGFTQQSEVQGAGAYLALIERIDHLKSLGVNAVELMPVFEFDETKVKFPPLEGRPVNYWGYNPLSFFAPMSRYASCPEKAIPEFKTMVRELHRAGIEVILDAVYNHTAESDRYLASLRGIDREAYYLLDKAGNDRDCTGCGNTIRANHPPATRLILDSMRYWVGEMRIDGFRFDLASVLTRGPDGEPMAKPPLLQAMAEDPFLKGIKLIAEPWDAAGLYQLGQFAKWGKFSTWNGKFRDTVRRFLKGTEGEAGNFAAVLSGSEPYYAQAHAPQASINFITAHDGFCLQDLVSYKQKRNLANGEGNRDGCDANESWNCGEEGPSRNPAVLALRERQMRNFFLALLLAQGVPMILMGDEIGHTRSGNNNPYNQDNTVNWFDWDLAAGQAERMDFVSSLIRFRMEYPHFRKTRFLNNEDVRWHGKEPGKPDWGASSRLVAFELEGPPVFYIAFHAGFQETEIALPPTSQGQPWRLVANTALGWNSHHFADPKKGQHLPQTVRMLPYSAFIAIH